ncbi:MULTISPECIES: DsbA family protein [unclassified Minwuia]|jgi:protein-disulfide isomerase|uniref:DsbA family protein n=1 Tax=unclassified Minwuia TaxID=2618799 RepID=UPI0024790583|nr:MULTISPECIES: DsbA family protein [unclassified Minwuia]
MTLNKIQDTGRDRNVSRRSVLVSGGIATGLAMSGLLVPGVARAADYAKGDMVLGDPEAPVEVIEYASMTCPHCRRFHEEIYPKLKKEFIETGKVRFVFREFPLDRYALQASMLARCGGEQKFFGFIDQLFQQQPNWTSASDPAAALRQIGLLGGVSSEAFDACMADESLVDMLLATRLDGHQRMKVSGTPSVYVNGEKFEGGLDFEALSDRIESAL